MRTHQDQTLRTLGPPEIRHTLWGERIMYTNPGPTSLGIWAALVVFATWRVKSCETPRLIEAQTRSAAFSLCDPQSLFKWSFRGGDQAGTKQIRSHGINSQRPESSISRILPTTPTRAAQRRNRRGQNGRGRPSAAPKLRAARPHAKKVVHAGRATVGWWGDHWGFCFFFSSGSRTSMRSSWRTLPL